MNGNIVLVWVGGTGVSALAGLFHELGYKNLIGIDGTESELTQQLQAEGINVIIWHGSYQVTPEDKVIYSAATTQSPEVLQAQETMFDNRKRIFPPMLYAQFLWEISKYMCTVAVTWTHGKSTTTGLTATALHATHSNFGIGIVWANVGQRDNHNYITNPTTINETKQIIDHIFDPKAPSIAHLMKKYLFVVEADEYNRHFHHLDPDYAIVTNIELDHADYYGDEQTYFEAYHEFARKVKQKIRMVEGATGGDVLSTFSQLTVLPIQHFAFESLLGSHNHGNATLALACATELLSHDLAIADDLHRSQKINDAKKAIEQFKGLRRRGELLTTNSLWAPIISDYGHHPTELASTLLAIKEKYPNKKITCVFQPHQARRVMEFWDEFIKTLKTVDKLIIYNIYAARENLDELKLRFTKFGHIETINQLGELFAKTAGGTYTTTFNDIAMQLIDSPSNSLVVIFTAGNLDFQIRNYLKKGKSAG